MKKHKPEEKEQPTTLTESFWFKKGDGIGISRFEKDRKFEIPDPTTNIKTEEE